MLPRRSLNRTRHIANAYRQYAPPAERRSFWRIIAEDPLQWEGERIILDVTFGVHIIRGGDDAGEALEAADRPMYANKTGEQREAARAHPNEPLLTEEAKR